MPFPSRSEYERLIYGLLDNYSKVVASTLVLYSTSSLTAVVQGSLTFHNGLELRIVELIDFKAERIRRYSYTVFRDEERVRWYDPEPHPENPDLAETFPHHFHEPPDIKHNRKPAPGISFDSPNLPTLIKDCIALGDSWVDNAANESNQGA
ncbi:MAG: hypothetical protein MAG451_03091 [Anaerolineales bacterium]|nr:hypothetical protein [Anaerolineales bacterium]